MKKLTYLFVMIDGGGNVPPMFGLMKKLLKRGHSVNVLSEPCLEQPIKELGCGFVPFTDYFTKEDRKEDVLQDHTATLFNNPVFETVMFGPAETVIDQTIEAAKSLETDVLMVDVLLFPALMVGEYLNIPKVLVFHMPEYMPGANRPPGNMGLKPGTGMLTRLRDRLLGKMMVMKFNEFKPKLNRVRTRLGLPPLTDTVDMMDMADLRIIQTLRSFDVPIEPAPANVRYTGPVLDDPDWINGDEWNSPWDADDNRPLVVISFSTTFQNQAEAIQNSINALKNLPVRGLVTLGMAMETEKFDVPVNVKVVNSVKHSLVFPHASAVVTHAGHGTIIRAFANGVPLVCMPMGRDQNDNAIKVELKGAGIKLSAKAEPRAIKEAVTKVLNDTSYRTNANRMKQELAAPLAMEAVLDEMEDWFAEWRKENPEVELQVTEGPNCEPNKACD